MNNLLKNKFYLVLLLIAGCMPSKYGSEQVDSALSSNYAINRLVDESEVDLEGDLEEDSLEEDKLNFLENVKSATYKISGSQLNLSLKDDEGNKIVIPEDVKSTITFKSTKSFLLINLSDSQEQTSLIVDKTTRNVYLTKDTDIQFIRLDSLATRTLKVNNVSQKVLRVRAVLSSTGKTVYVGLAVLGSKLNAYKM